MSELNEKLSLYKFPIILSLVGLVLLISGILSSGLLTKSSSSQAYPKQSLVNILASSPSSDASLNQVVVDLSGAVANPGVYNLSTQSRLSDLIKLAGGFSANVNKNYISKYLNMSQRVSDGQKIYIPFIGEEGLSLPVTTGPSGVTSGSGPIGLNSASQDQLETLPAIGPVTAQTIISNRPYTSVDDLINKKVVSKSAFAKIKALVDIH